MSNGSGLFGDPSTTQTLIVPNPSDTNLYYLFTLDAEDGANGFNYSVVNMALNNGNGDVSVKNTHLKNNMTEKVAGVYHCNNHDIWVMTHEYGTNAFYAYLVTDNGINSPVVSNVGTIHSDVHGYMKFTSDGSKLACAIGFRDTVDLFDFDKSTGIVSNPLTMGFGEKVYGLEFSPDNSKLYGSYYSVDSGFIYQLDLSTNDIFASKTIINRKEDPHRALQLGPDGKIYIPEANTPFLDVIDLPNELGSACNFEPQVINIDPDQMGYACTLGLPGFIQSYFNPEFPNVTCDIALGTEAIATPDKSVINPNPATDDLFINSESGEIKSIEIYDLPGRIIYTNEAKNNAGSVKLDIHSLLPGVYFVKIVTGKTENIQKLIKQ